MKINPKFQSLIPPLSPEELAQLEANLVADGCRDPLVTWNGILLDGHNRHAICTRLGIEFETRAIELQDEDAAMDWIETNQLGRRNLQPQQISVLRGNIYNRRKKAQHRPEKRDQNDPVNPKRTAEIVAAETGVSAATIKRDGKIAAEVAADPELQAAIANRTEFKKVRKKKRKVANEKREREAAESAPDCSAFCVTDSPVMKPCAAIITDPPYGILDEPWEPKKLETFTRKWLCDWNTSGADFILSFWSQRYLFAGREWFDSELTKYKFQQLLVWHYPNNKSPQSREGFKQTWEPIFFYRHKNSKKQIRVGGSEWGKGLNDFDCHVAAVPQTNFNGSERKQHPAQKPVSVMRWLINAVTQKNEMVIDPFCGSGTTGIAAVQLGRLFHGIETDPEFIKLARRRIAAYGKFV